MLAFILMVVGILSRIIVHTPNFTPVIALALFGGFYLSRRHALIVPVALMVISDLVIGLHDLFVFTWGSVALIAVLGIWARRYKSPGMMLGSSIVSACLFFLVTNFGVWLLHYPLTLEGFVRCYTLAVPFFRSLFVSTLIYSAVFFGVYEFVAWRVRKTRFAPFLLAA